MIVATAGHVDHGKTSLVKALTGIDTDRLAEEKRRGLSIDLGFAYTHLTAPDQSRVRVGFVDVPGHQRFTHNMLAGIPGVRLVLLVIAANDGVMPQTREHVDILRLLGVQRAVVALSHADRANAERIAQLRSELQTWLAPVFATGLDIVETSVVDGRGIATVSALLAAEAVRQRAPDDSQQQFRLAIDRGFSIQGAGSVATGFVHSGRCEVGDLLRLMPSAIEVRTRGIRVLDEPTVTATAGARAAINVLGVEHRDLQRGQWLTASDGAAPSHRLSASMQLLESAPYPLDRWRRVHVHHGAAHVLGRIGPLGGPIAPGERGLVELRLDAPVVAVRGDLIVIRNESATVTVGGGDICEPLIGTRSRRTDVAARADAYGRGSPGAVLAALLQPGTLVDVDRFRQALNVGADTLEQALQTAGAEVVVSASRRCAVSGRDFGELLSRIEATVHAWHKASPHQTGLRSNQLAALLGPGVDWLGAGIRVLLSRGSLQQTSGFLHVPGHRPRMEAADAKLFARIEAELTKSPRPPALRDLSQSLGLPASELAALLRRVAGLGLLVQVSPHRYFLPPALAQLAHRAATLAASSVDGHLDTQAFRDGTGIGRNTAIEVLEHFDSIGFTRRTANSRVVLRAPDDIFGAASQQT